MILWYFNEVTILILIDGFLQYKIGDRMVKTEKSHNPYFNRWFSAIEIKRLQRDSEYQSQSLF